MKFKLFLLNAVLLVFGSVFGNDLISQTLPANQFHFKSGNDLIYYSYTPNKTDNTTEIVFETYGSDQKKKDTKKLIVKDIAAKILYLVNVAYNEGQFVFMQIYLKTKVFGNTGVMVYVGNDFSIQAQKKYPEEIELFAGYKDDFFKKDIIPYLPLDHTTLDSKTFLVESQLDFYTATGGMIYMRRDDKYELFSSDFTNKETASDVNSALYYYEPVKDGFKKQWAIDLPEEIILNYKVYGYGDFVFLYTSYIPAGQRLLSSSVQSKIRRIDKQTGKIQFECLLERKEGYELMLSNVCFDEADQSFYFTGNYYTNMEFGKWILNRGAKSLFFWGKVNATGVMTNRTIDLENWLKQDGEVSYQGVVFARIVSFEKLKDGSFCLGGSLFCSGNDIYVNNTSYLFMPFGIVNIRINSNLDEISKIKLLMTKGKLLAIQNSIYNINIRVLLISSPETDCKFGLNSFWNKENETLILSQYYANENPTVTSNLRIALYVAKFENGKQALFKNMVEVNSAVQADFGKTYLLNEKQMIYQADLDPLQPMTVLKIE